MKLEIASLSHIGKVRQNNEDALGYFEPSGQQEKADKGTMFVVADGMGGHRGGEIASNLAVKTIISSYYAHENGDPVKSLEAAFAKANKAILERSQTDASLLGMGTTCTAMVVRNGKAYFAHVGDSRAYVMRDGTLEQLTEDHSLVGEMVRSGIISDEDAQHHPKRNVITRSMGSHEELPIDFPSSPYDISAGDIFLLCSDGLTSLVTDEEVGGILGKKPPEDAVNALVDLANDKGGKDNVTVQIVKVSALD